MSIGNTPDIWQGRPVFTHPGGLDQLIGMLPRFEKRPFGERDSANEFFMQVVRLPMRDDSRRIPVGLVSPDYLLIQHTDLVGWLRQGLRDAKIEESPGNSTLYISTYGERMKLWITLQGLEFDPGDGYPLGVVVTCQNSVDGSCALEIKIIQVRWVCGNGLVSGPGGKIRKTHVPRLIDVQDIANEITHYLEILGDEQKILSGLLRSQVSEGRLNQWVDTTVAKNWGAKDAARVASICRSGNDGTVKAVKDERPSCWQVGWDVKVPGAAAPVNNLYHAAQALSWVASRHPHLDVRMKRIEEIPEMVGNLGAE
jgi:hypothetical protein